MSADMHDTTEPAPELAVIHHNNEAIDDIAADILRREELGQLPRMEYGRATC
ncbi:MAG: hypothetical protein WA159_02945 [Variovorax sp.]